ncbi:MAG: aldehyde dehydrogenase family protein [Actinomycetes bacterium]|jgi:acyl-CoA reductase-like NAD-dependent aldehyde dehydrogenase
MATTPASRIDVLKTYKLFIGGAFPRSESGRVYAIKDFKGNHLANPSLASRKDLRDAVVAARSAFPGWSSASAYNRGQILYRMAEILEGRSEQLVTEIVALEGVTPRAAALQVQQSVDLLVWYAGWSDKISALAGSTNSVSGPYYNFSTPEPIGVVAIFAAAKPSLLNLIAAIASVITSGNTAVVIASEKFPLPAITFSEIMATSDLPAGVVNVLTGSSAELAPWAASHMDIDSIDASGLTAKQLKETQLAGAQNLKRIRVSPDLESPARILSFMEIKTVWHPIGI